jgi:O-antigen/teichoic acid export membrane protein
MIITYIANAFAIIIGFVSMYLITNYISVEVYGILAIITATSGILTNLVSARTSEAIVRFVKEEMIKGDKENIKFILFIGFFVDFFIGVMIVGLFLMILIQRINYLFF